jgi:acyl transferase domain-containing protein/SAM-dependent methyltransferase/acyl carrier protein
MSEFLERIKKLSPKRLALLALELHEQVEAAKRADHEPIAVIGMGCRFPGGAGDPDSFWDLLVEGRDAINKVPSDRWDSDAYFDPDPDAPGRIGVKHGGFLERVDGFDSAFFGIAPREALAMDPQQRLLLEVTWEALEHAGVSADRLAGTPTGVFIGICNSDHFQRLVQRGPNMINAYLASGNAMSVAAGRISYFLGTQGPSLSVDTACSSSLVALHLACRSLRSHETNIALCGGVNIMCAPETTIALTKAHMLAPDGRCKTFDAAADGFSRGEGCGVLVLKRLNDALSSGDRILAVVRGTAVNQDGRSGGLTVPNGPAQEAVIRSALADAQVEAADIGYVEAHGTGTSLGDPIEVRALGRALGLGRQPDNPVLIGSVKTNIGHLESAAGIAGVIKVILSLQHERIPPHLHFREPSPHIAWAEYPVNLPAEGCAWPRGGRSRLAGVSSFGFSGTNAHAVIEEAPIAIAKPRAAERPLHCVPFSARSEAALVQLAQRYVDAMAEKNDVTIADIAHTAGAGRSHFEQRLAIVAESKESMTGALQAFLAGNAHPALHRGAALAGTQPDVVFLFTGQGSQYPGMGRELYDCSPVFRNVIDQCDALIGADKHGRTLKTIIWSTKEDGSLHETEWTQPALFAIEYGLTQLWRSWGIEPAAVIGHSVGEYVAACVAGVFSLEDGLRLIVERGRLMQSLPPGGSMAALFAPESAVSAAIESMSERVTIAAINGPEHVVISGEAAAVEAVAGEFAKRNVRTNRLFVSTASHSPLVAPALDAMEACAQRVEMRAPRIPVAWNVTGGALPSGSVPNPEYWRRHLREPVKFADGINYLHQQGYRTFLEVGPHPTLIALAQQCTRDEAALFLHSLRRDKDDWTEISQSVAKLYVHGAPIDWTGIDTPNENRRVSLPTYPFERRSYWHSPNRSEISISRTTTSTANSLSGSRLPTAVPLFECTLQPDRPRYLAEHRVRGAVLVAGPVFLEMAQSCASEAFGPAFRAVKNFVIHEPLVLTEPGRTVQVQFGDVVGDAIPFFIHSRPSESNGAWQLHVRGVLTGALKQFSGDSTIAIAELKKSLGPVVSSDGYYESLAKLGIDIGPGFRSVREAYQTEGVSLGRVECSPARGDDVVSWIHPVLLDGALQTAGLAIPKPSPETQDIYLLSEIEHIELTLPLPPTVWCHAVVRQSKDTRPHEWRVDLTVHSPSGQSLGFVRGICMRRASEETLNRVVQADGRTAGDNIFYRLAWEASPIAAPAASSLVSPERFSASAQKVFIQLADENGLRVYDKLLPELDRLSAEYIASALRRMGFDDTVGRIFTVDAESKRLGIVERHARLFERFVEILIVDGNFRRHHDRIEVVCRLPASDPLRDNQALLEQFGAVDGELRTLQRCGPELARVLTGTQDPLKLLFPGGSLAEARKLYFESPYARTYNATLAETLKSAIADIPTGAKLRILEIGAGTGGTTAHLLPMLPADRVEYTFTDISRLFLDRAAEQFATYPFIRRTLLDIERDPLNQGFKAGQYDIVVAANVLHATSDLRDAVQHVRTLLAPDGLLVLLEGVTSERWVDLTFGLTEGWWRFTDLTLRENYPLIGRQAWRGLLNELGFTQIIEIPEDTEGRRSAAQQAMIVARAPRSKRQWTIAGDPNGVGTALANLLRTRGDAATVLDGDIGPAERDARGGDLIYLGALEVAFDRSDDPLAIDRCKKLSCDLPLRWLAEATRLPKSARVWLVTQGAQPASGVQSPGARWQAPLWGLGRVFALEHPDVWGGLIDLPAEGTSEEIAATLLAALDAGGDEDQSAWRGGVRLVPRIVPDASHRNTSIRLRPDATYLITGGFGGLGLLVGRLLAELGAKHVALLGRRPDPQCSGVRAIENLGARVISLAGDVADEAAMKVLLARLAGEAPPLRGIVHAAADFSSAPIRDLTASQVQKMLRSKIDGTCVLERIVADEDIDFLVLFSSSTAVLGASGFAHYAAANLFLDATATAADQRGRRVLSVNWGTWEAMRLASAEEQRSFRQSGLEPMPADLALRALTQLLAGTEAQSIVARIDWDVLRPLHEARRPRPLLSQVGRASSNSRAVGTQAAKAPLSLVKRLEQLAPEARRDQLLDFVRGEVAAVLGLDGVDSLPLERGLFEMGMDSLMSVELGRRLERGVGRSLPSTLTFNYPNVAALAEFLDREFAPTIVPAGEAIGSVTALPHASNDDLESLTDLELEARLAARLKEAG